MLIKNLECIHSYLIIGLTSSISKYPYPNFTKGVLNKSVVSSEAKYRLPSLSPIFNMTGTMRLSELENFILYNIHESNVQAANETIL
jgi:hypothetical protein